VRRWGRSGRRASASRRRAIATRPASTPAAPAASRPVWRAGWAGRDAAPPEA